MSILTVASGQSVYRGYEYYTQNKVLVHTQINDNEFEGFVKGSEDKPYKVHINIAKPKTSTCDCPFANGKRVCKHMVAVFFAAFPKEAEQYIAELEAYYEEEENRYEELDNMIQEYIKKLTKPQLQEILLQVLYDGPEWQFERFIREYIEY